MSTNDQFMMGKKIAYLDRNEYNYGPAPEIEKVLRNFDPEMEERV